jgi:hypothetical protein
MFQRLSWTNKVLIGFASLIILLTIVIEVVVPFVSDQVWPSFDGKTTTSFVHSIQGRTRTVQILRAVFHTDFGLRPNEP